MTLQSIYEQDKERLVSVWSGADKKDIIRTVGTELDRVLYAFNDQEENPRVQQAASAMIRTAKASAGFLDTDGVTRVYGRTDYIGGTKQAEEDKRKNGRLPKKFWILRALGILCAVPYVYITYRLLSQVSKEWQWYLLISTPVAAMLLLFLAGLFLRRTMSPDREQIRAEVLTDPMKVYHQVLAVLLVIDKNLEEIRSTERIEERRQQKEEAQNVDSQELELLQELLEDAYARRDSDEQAAESITRIKFYLHTKHIDVVDWSDPAAGNNAADAASGNGEGQTALLPSVSELNARRGWFDMIPAYAAGTIRPALTADGRLLRKGLASAGQLQS